MVVAIKNVRVFTENGAFVKGQVCLEDGLIKKVELSGETEVPERESESGLRPAVRLEAALLLTGEEGLPDSWPD